MLKKLIVVLLLLVTVLTLNAQNQNDSIALHLTIEWNKSPLALNKTYVSKQKDSIQLNQLKFYLSNIELLYNDGSIFYQKKHHLIDLQDINTLRIPVCKKDKKIISQIIFSLGVDSLASTSGALSGDLDPSKGMYWAWQSGYINMKMEGTSPSCKTHKNSFHFHIGGYAKPNNALRKIVLIPNSNAIKVGMDVSFLFDHLNLSENNSIMIPGKKAMEFADMITKIITIE